MQMRFRIARTITIDGFTPDPAPGADTSAHVSLDEWIADQAGSVPTKGHNLRLRFLNAAGAELFGGSVSLSVWAKTDQGFWAVGPVVVGGSAATFLSNLTGSLFFAISSIGITDIPTATTLQILVQENSGVF